MKTPVIPPDEPARLQWLRALHILDTEQDPTFDSIAELARTLCDVPMAAISLLDEDRQWFKAAVGLGTLVQTPREQSLCGHVVGDASFLVIADTHQDDRFARNPLVTGEPHIRFYAGAPLITRDGAWLGALCVMDRSPGRLSEAQRSGLERLAALTMRLLEARGAESGRRESEQRFRAMADSAPVMIWMSDAEQQLQYVNRAWLQFTGLSLEQVREHQWASTLHPDDRQRIHAEAATAGQTQRFYRTTCRVRHADGTYRWLLTQAEPRFDADGHFTGYVGSNVDFTEERHSREELQRAEERLRLIVAGSNDATWDWNLVTDDLYYSPRWWEMLGLAPESMPADSGLWMRRLHVDDRGVIEQLFREVYEQGLDSFEVEFRLQHASGDFVPVLCRGRVQRGADSAPLRVAGTNTDLTERRRAEAARNEALDLLQQVAARIPGVVYQYRVRADGSSCFPYASDGMRQIYGVTPEQVANDASPVFAVLHPEDLAGVAASIEESRQSLAPWNYEYRTRQPDGTIRWLHGNGVPQREADGSVLWHGYITDCTARKAAEQERESLAAQLRESQKMQAVGTLAGGIAHDFNNITGVILGNAELARQDIGDNPSALESLSQIRAAAERARGLTRQILSFSRRQPTTPRRVALGPRIEGVVQLLRKTLLTRAAIHCHLDPDSPEVLADVVQMDQVLINLLTNAAQAIGDQTGQIDVRLDTLQEAPPTGATGATGTAPQRYARIRISDTGSGMDDVQLQRIFEPFYTTKPVDKGTGLGLAVVYGIMQAHQGRVSVTSKPGRGSTFTLLLPAAADAPEPARPVVREIDAAPPQRYQHILYVDDDESLLFMCKRLLERQGYRVSTESSAERGLDLLRRDPLAFDLLLLDYNMPAMNGIDMARQVRALNTALPIAIASGFITDGMRAEAAQVGIHDLIFKPNVVQEYCDVVDRLLGISG